MTSEEALFATQGEDVLSGQLQHRFEQLPERGFLADARAARSATAAEVRELDLERLEMTQRQTRLEGEVISIDGRLVELDDKLYKSGAITTAREASALQEEIAHLRRRKDVLEGEVLELMENLEPTDEQLTELATLANHQDTVVAEAELALNQCETSVTDDLAQSSARRQEAVGELSLETLTRYEKSRAAFGSSAVVRFAGSDCKGCPLSMPAVEADRVRGLPAGTLADCLECGRIVAR
ncbi:MAG: hypothetical protein VX833_00360 [Actinomycetota bacterium]|nr:hypothetical protein [Actinomycetota bacterium]